VENTPSVDIARASGQRAELAELERRVVALERSNRDKEELLARERQLRAQLEAAHAANDRLLSVLSHDLRTPLNAVLGWTQLLRRERLDQNARDRALATIERNAQAQLQLVEDLLDISRLGSGGAQLERVSIDLGELVERAVHLVARTAKDRGVELTTAIAHERLVLTGDRRRLERALSRLLPFAIAQTSKDGRITAVVTRARANGAADGPLDWAKIALSGTGQSIPREKAARVLDPFLPGAERGALGGVDLTLYLVRQAVELHGGRLRAEQDGLAILLPLDASSAHRVASAAQSTAAPRGERDREEALEGIGVLVVEEEDDARELMTTILRERGAAVTAVADLATALATLHRATPDVVVRGAAALVAMLRRASGERAD
jgi:signal transduction histidine kinase